MKRKFLVRALAFTLAFTGAFCTTSCYVSGFQDSSASSSASQEAHNWQSVYSSNHTYHWFQCNDCEYGLNIEEHSLNESDVCTVCGYSKTTDGLMYQISADGTYAEVTAFWRTDATVRIADTYQGVPVTKIGDGAFADKTLVSVIIPEGVTTIGNSAFSGCNSLTSVTLPNSLTTIEASAFMECDSLTNVALGDNVTYIGNSAFQECSSLVSISIPSGVTFVSSSAFDYCHSLTYTACENAKYLGNENNPYVILSGVTDTNAESYTIHENTKFIFDGAFANCVNLKSVSVPNGVTAIGEEVFANCTSLTSATLGNGVAAIGKNAFANCTSLTSVSIPDGVTSVNSSAFSNCTGLTYTTHENINYLGNASNPYVVLAKVADTTSTSYTIPQTTKIIFDNAFENCKYATSMIVPDSVTSVGASAFYKCSKLTSISIGKGVLSIGTNAFRNCSKLTEISVSKDNTAYLSINGNLYTKDGKTLLQYALGKTDTTLIVPEGVVSIGDASLAACKNLTSVTLPSTVTYIGINGFNNCSNLTDVTIPLGVTTIGYNAFKSCTNLTIYCEAESKPDGWHNAWNSSNCSVVWGHKA